MPMPIDLEDAVDRVAARARVRTMGQETIALDDTAGRTLAEDLVAPEDVPPFANSAMDGYAVRASDVAVAGVELKVIGESRAGKPAAVSVEPGAAVAISTGAVLPAGADAVVRVEDTERSGEGLVMIDTPVDAGLNIRRPGEDLHAGEVALHQGSLIGPAELGVLAAIGVAEVPCVKPPQVTVLVTGSELVEPGQRLEAGQIYNSNGFAVPAQIHAAGAQVTEVVRVADDHDGTVAAVEQGLHSDILIVCGGVSVGAHDHVKSAFAKLGVEQEFWGVKLRPGHPTWFGATESTLVFGLPGNPVSAMVTCELFVKPAIELMLGRSAGRAMISAILDTDFPKKSGYSYAIRCKLQLGSDGWHAAPTKAQGSHILTSMVDADALALLPAESGSIAAGESVPILLFR